MKKIFLLWLLLLFSLTKIIAQTPYYTDSLKQKLASVKEDTAKVNLLFNLAITYLFAYADTSATYAKQNGRIEISVKDNGNGIPQKVVDKIFQPFFTTKPTGEGTGLGLSLSYDIIKAHGGQITVETKEGEGSTFIVHLSNTVLL